MLGAASANPTSVRVGFTEAMGEGSTDPASYAITGPGGSPSLSLACCSEADPSQVTLTTAPQEKVGYTLTVALVKSQAGQYLNPGCCPGAVPGLSGAGHHDDVVLIDIVQHINHLGAPDLHAGVDLHDGHDLHHVDHAGVDLYDGHHGHDDIDADFHVDDSDDFRRLDHDVTLDDIAQLDHHVDIDHRS